MKIQYNSCTRNSFDSQSKAVQKAYQSLIPTKVEDTEDRDEIIEVTRPDEGK